MKREDRDPDEKDLHENAMDDEETVIDVAIYILSRTIQHSLFSI